MLLDPRKCTITFILVGFILNSNYNIVFLLIFFVFITTLPQVLYLCHLTDDKMTYALIMHNVK